MAKFFKNIIILLVALIAIDRIGGYFLQKIFYKQYHGDDYVTIKSVTNTADVLIFGSSRASHHYISDTIEKYTGLTTFNGGRDNMGIHYVAAILPAVIASHCPKQIILDLIPNNFCIGGQSSTKYFDIHTNTLLPFATKYPTILQYVEKLNSIEALKSKLCASYAYNSLLGNMFQNSYTNLGHKEIKGYEPIYNAIDTATYNKPLFNEDELKQEPDTAAINELANILALCKTNNIKTTIVLSPFYYPRVVRPIIKQALLQLQLQYGFALKDYSLDESLVGQPTLFYDELHLNNTGAALLTKKVLEE